MRRSLELLLGLMGLLCTQYIVHADTINTIHFEPEALAEVPKIELSPVVVKRIKAAPATPLWLKRMGPPKANWPYAGPSDMAVTIEGVIYLLNVGNPYIIRGSVDTDTVEGLDLPRQIPGDAITHFVLDQRAVYSPVMGTAPPLTILVNMGTTSPRVGPQTHLIVGRYAFHPNWEPYIQWQHFLRLEQVFSASELQGINVASWGYSISLDREGSAYVGFREKESGVSKAAMFDPHGYFIKIVPSHLRDGQGFYYKHSGNELLIYDAQEQQQVRVKFPEYPDPGNPVVFSWQTVDKGVWIKIALPGEKPRQAYVHFGADGKPKEWFEYTYETVRGELHRTMLNPFFCLDGNFYFGAIEATTTDAGEEVTYIIFRSSLKIPHD